MIAARYHLLLAQIESRPKESADIARHLPAPDTIPALRILGETLEPDVSAAIISRSRELTESLLATR